MKKKHNQGFSLVELVIAVAILAIIMVAIASFMTSTTKSYNRAKNDAQLQQTGQELFDMISDKVMQAKEIRIGRDGKEYAILGTNLSTQENNAGQLLKEDGSPASTSGSGYELYSYRMLTPEDTDIDYICICYEGMNTFGGKTGYGPIVDVYYFDSGNVYLKRNTGGVRNSSLDKSTDGSPVETLDNDNSRVNRDNMINTSIDDWASVINKDDYLVCKNIENVYAYSVADENAIYLQIDLGKKGIENVSQGMITIRNSYVLQPAGYQPPTP